MDFKEIKKLMGENGRCVIVEDDKPAYVVLTAKEFLVLPVSPAKQRSESEGKAEPALPILPPTMSELQNRGSSIFSPNQINSEKIGTKPGGGQNRPAAEPPAAGKESSASFVNFEDVNAVSLQDITFEDFGIDELPD